MNTIKVVFTPDNIITMKKKSKHRCYFCGTKFEDIKLLKKHIASHRDRPYACLYCEKAFSDPSTLCKHKLTHTGERSQLCEFCGNTYTLKCSLTKHIETAHRKTAFDCIACNPDVVKSPAGQPNSRLYLCKSCRAQGKIMYKNGAFKCRKCLMFFTECVELNKHVLMCKGSKLHENETTDEDPPFGCAICEQTFSSPGELCIHWLSHSDEMPFHCTKCDKKFQYKNDFKRHDITHHRKSLRKCKFCRMCFADEPNLKKHEQKHSEPRPFSCDECGLAFKAASILKKHELTHLPDRPYNCSICGNSFKYLWSLKQHKLSHMEDKSIICNICNKTFKYRGSYQRHMCIHNGGQKYHCPICGRKYARSYTLQLHLASHAVKETMNDFVCPVCDTEFKTVARYHKHMLRHSKNACLVMEEKDESLDAC